MKLEACACWRLWDRLSCVSEHVLTGNELLCCFLTQRSSDVLKLVKVWFVQTEETLHRVDGAPRRHLRLEVEYSHMFTVLVNTSQSSELLRRRGQLLRLDNNPEQTPDGV